MVIKQLNIRGDNCYFYNDLVNLKDFDPNLIELDRNELANDVFIYHVNYAGICPLRLYIRELGGYFTEEKREGWSNKYLNISLTDSNDVLINYAKVWEVIGDRISEMCNGLEGEYSKDLMKIMVNSVFKKSNKYYPQIFLADCLYDDV